MPELPDVEGFRRVLSEHAVGSRIERVEVLDAGVLRGVSVRSLRDSLRGRRFGTPRRHGKWLIAPLLDSRSKASRSSDAPAVMLHFGMTGALEWARQHDDDPAQERHRHDRVVFGLPSGELRYRDMRKLRHRVVPEVPAGRLSAPPEPRRTRATPHASRTPATSPAKRTACRPEARRTDRRG